MTEIIEVTSGTADAIDNSGAERMPNDTDTNDETQCDAPGGIGETQDETLQNVKRISDRFRLDWLSSLSIYEAQGGEL